MGVQSVLMIENVMRLKMLETSKQTSNNFDISEDFPLNRPANPQFF